MTPDIKATLANLPDRPGVYLMKDARGEVLYVGKAQSLRSRVRSYWQKQAATSRGEIHRIRQVIDKVVDLEVTEVDSVSEALLLEANLIKRFKPRFNIRLKDDKSYPYIKITLGDDFPRIERTRRLPQDGSRYFGPYASASSVDEAMNLVRRLFPFVFRPLQVEPMREAARHLLGTHDFSSFRAAECQARSPVKTMHEIRIERQGDLIVFTLRANAFLHHMVRNIVGSLIVAGNGNQSPDWIKELLEGRDRSRAAPTFMPDGLYLAKIDYDAKWGLPQDDTGYLCLGLLTTVVNTMHR